MFNKYRDVYVVREVAPYKVDGLAIPYPEFVSRLYNLCMELGFRKGLIMPSRAFCSDENQGLHGIPVREKASASCWRATFFSLERIFTKPMILFCWN